MRDNVVPLKSILVQYVRKHFLASFISEPILNSTLQLKTYIKDKLPLIGKVKVSVSYNNHKGNFMLYIVKGKGSNFLDHNWLEHLILDWKALAACFCQL